ncbi:MAG: LLM class flavin-dependent oxidoreductase [Candidatus Rokubacteria bacterium]|nr:LLM class flavin-dependent oxidoreductase [Candidatus Rokubacteria bacterium]
MRTGLLVLPSRPARELADLAAHAEALGYDDFWVADERFFREVYSVLTLAATRTTRMRLGPCVTDPFSRHPALTAMAIATLDDVSGGRAVLGIGAGVSGFRELGLGAEGSATAIREGVEVIRRLLAGERVTFAGKRVSLVGGALDFAPPRADLPVYVASQREAGCRVAGRLADGAIMQGCVARPLLRFFREAVAQGARRAARSPERVELVARLNVCIADDRKAARDLMRPGIVRSLVAQRPDFFTFHMAGGVVSHALREQVLRLPYTHDPAPLMAVAPLVPDELVDAVTLTGPPAVVASEVVRLAAGGIGQVMILAVGPDGGRSTIERFQTEVMPRVREALGVSSQGRS